MPHPDRTYYIVQAVYASRSHGLSETNEKKEVKKMIDLKNAHANSIAEAADLITDAASEIVEESVSEQSITPEPFNITELPEDAFSVTAPGTGKTVRETTTGDTAKIFNAVSGASDPVKSLLGQVVEVTDIVVTSTDVHEIKDDEDSPLINRPVVHFYTVDGQHYASLSNGIVRTTKALLECGLCPTPENPLKIKFRTVETKKGTAHIFELA